MTDNRWIELVEAIFGIILSGVLLLLGVAILTSPISIQIFRAWKRRRPQGPPRLPPKLSGFPLSAQSSHPVLPIQEDGAGRYRIVGVVASTGVETKMYVHAETRANAKAKAELRGVVVTEIIKHDSPPSE